MADRTDAWQELIASLQQRIEAYTPEVEVAEIGEVIEAGDGIARCSGLSNVMASELVEFENGVMGIAFNLERDNVGVIILGDFSGIRQGMKVRGTGRIASVRVGQAMLGRVVGPLGRPPDVNGPIVTARYRLIERIARGVT